MNQAKYITEEMLALLEKLCNADGVSGNESEVRKIIREELAGFVDECFTDSMGNLIAIKRPSGEAKLRVLVDAHLDEVGFMIVKSGDDEFCEFRALGGIDARALPAKVVRIGSDKVPGVISPRTAHLTTAEERKSIVSVDKLQITLGTEQKAKVHPGDYAAFHTDFSLLGDCVAAKALDDRVGCANVIWLLKHAPKDIELVGVFAVQEELGLRGATAAAFRIHPDLAFALDTTPALDPPLWDDDEVNVQYNAKAGKGPVIYTVDASQIHFQSLIHYLVDQAEQNEIQYQLRQPGGGGTDSGAIHLQHDGILSQSISVPVRYLHSPRGLMRISDWEDTLHLLDCALQHAAEAKLTEVNQ